MALSDKRDEAEKLYVSQDLSCPAIAKRLGIDPGTVYRWKADAAKKNEALDWDAKRRIYNMSLKEIFGLYAESFKSWIVRLKENPELLSDAKVADALSKHISNLNKIDARSQYLGCALDLIKVISAWLDKHEPELKAKLDPHWDAIYLALKEYTTSKELF